MTKEEAKELEELLRDKTVECSACGTEMPDNALLCPKCGRFNASPIFAAPVSSVSNFYAASTPPLVVDSEPDGAPFAVSEPYGSATMMESASSGQSAGMLFATPMKPVSFGTPEEVPPEGEVAEPPAHAPEPRRQPAAQGRSSRETPLAQSERQVRRIRFGSDGDEEQEIASEGTGLSPYLGGIESRQAHPSQYGMAQPGREEGRGYTYTVGRAEQIGESAQVTGAHAFQREMFAYVGFLGAGHIYAGHVMRGLMLMVGWWVFLPWTILTVLFNNGGGCLFLSAMLVPVVSGLWASASVKRQPEDNKPAGSQRR